MDNDRPVLKVDGRRPLSADRIDAIGEACDRAEAHGSRIVLHVSGAPEGPWADDLTVSLVSKWERALRRLERLPAATVAVADGDCGGLALDALLATDYRIATGSVRLVMPVRNGATWPGMALYRLGRQGAGASAIRRAVLFGTPVEAAEALAVQLVDEVVDDPARALELAGERLTAVAGSELAIRRQLMLEASTIGFEEALGAHLAACDRALRRAAAGVAP
ncbi:enoyl-CoA hydratase/isomerase [Streptomyces sp. CBMAI 2042]|uniref:enoyl-CoA-hydratase DpgB n=1 Tax=Streptomyces sp. CBMAI 2042 TaxID=2305222 RepID=UPI000F27E5E9|nr:enoyl-CoA-hydratase DpgB [Streptomyces sp. CBMAI 2042]RLV70617.1 enoyl-CoA hydratase/isomerase [Streptomyces sp. CBMAI 2042]